MKGSDFLFDYVHLLHYKCYKINLNLSGSYIDSPDWIKNKKPAIKKMLSICYNTLNHEDIGKYAEKNNKPFIDKYN